MLETGNTKPETEYRGVSSTVKLSVSKTELGGSNPSAPARVFGEKGQEQIVDVSRDEENGKFNRNRQQQLWRPGQGLAGAHPDVL